jgi:hypothetical protein
LVLSSKNQAITKSSEASQAHLNKHTYASVAAAPPTQSTQCNATSPKKEPQSAESKSQMSFWDPLSWLGSSSVDRK